ncbi:MAG: class I SAM-dependent methyltransferase [Butyrivibrio sp.]|nr:class I SAM-dependent methyltransferase [Butyrivibrio sp.]
MQEEQTIGKVNLNYKHYSGLDLYSDGAIENDLLDIVKNHKREEYQEIIEQRANWPILYHLSEQRGNIVEWIPMEGKEKVLEVGSGCGAITGTLSQKAGSVTCVDLSKRRSEINAWRNKDCNNVTIHVGNFRDIEPDLDKDFNFIFLIGVFEYGQGYIGTEHPYENFLMMLKKHLAPGGRIVIAIENRTGLKYFAGCSEDHLGSYFTGIEGYSEDSVARTFTRNGLIRIFRRCGITDYHFYYPYPDYKLMTMLHSDQYMPKQGELYDNVRNYDRDRLVLFNERQAYDGLVQDGMYPEFANSFEVILGPGFQTIYSKYSNDRADEYKIRTDIEIDQMGRKVIRKHPLTPEAIEHVRNMRSAYEGLQERFKGGDLEINDCQLDERDNSAIFSFVNGIPLSTMFDICVAKDDKDGFKTLFNEYCRRIDYNEKYPVADYDLIFSNIIVNGPIWTIIDYEWTYGKCIASKELAFRALYCYSLEDSKRESLGIEDLYNTLGFSEEEQKSLIEEESEFQKYVTGNRKSMVEIWKLIGKDAKTPRELAMTDEGNQGTDLIQVYLDKGNGYSEEESFFPEEAYDDHQTVKLDIETEEDIKTIRIDPAFNRCIVTLKNVLWNDISIESEDIDVSIIHNGKWISDDTIIFDTVDPNIEFGISEKEVSAKGNHLIVKMVMTMIPEETAGSIVGAIIEKEEAEIEPEKISFKEKIKNKIKSIKPEMLKNNSDFNDYDDNDEIDQDDIEDLDK